MDLVRNPGLLLPLRPDTVPQAPYLTLLTGHPSGQHPLTKALLVKIPSPVPLPLPPGTPLKSYLQPQIVHRLTAPRHVSTTSSPPSPPVSERQACFRIAFTLQTHCVYILQL